MSDSKLLGFFLFCTFGWLSVGIASSVLFSRTEIIVAPGFITGIDQCQEACVQSAGTRKCLYVPFVSLEWTYNSIIYTASNYSIPVNFCQDKCCYNEIDSTVQVQIKAEEPQVPVVVWQEGETPFSIGLLVLMIISFLVFAVCAFLLFLFIKDKRKEYSAV